MKGKVLITIGILILAIGSIISNFISLPTFFVPSMIIGTVIAFIGMYYNNKEN